MSRICSSLVIVSATTRLSVGCKQRALNQDSRFNAVPFLNGQYTNSPSHYLYLNEQYVLQGFDCGGAKGEVTHYNVTGLQ